LINLFVVLNIVFFVTILNDLIARAEKAEYLYESSKIFKKTFKKPKIYLKNIFPIISRYLKNDTLFNP